MSHFSHIRMFANPFPFCFKTILRFLALSVPLIAAQLTAATVVSNLTASQRAGTKLVDIGYDLTATGFTSVQVSLEVSSDGGATWTVPVTTISGDIGGSVAPGAGKAIVWDAGVDWSLSYSTQMRFRVMAYGFSLIPGGSFTMGRTSGDTDSDAPPITVTVSPFYIQQTETTKDGPFYEASFVSCFCIIKWYILCLFVVLHKMVHPFLFV